MSSHLPKIDDMAFCLTGVLEVRLLKLRSDWPNEDSSKDTSMTDSLGAKSVCDGITSTETKMSSQFWQSEALYYCLHKMEELYITCSSTIINLPSHGAHPPSPFLVPTYFTGVALITRVCRLNAHFYHLVKPRSCLTLLHDLYALSILCVLLYIITAPLHYNQKRYILAAGF